MAEDKILFKIEVNDEGVVTKLLATKKGFQDIDLTTKNAKNSAEQLNAAIAGIGQRGAIKNIKLTEGEYKKLVKTQDQLKNSSGGATSAVLELGRVVQDAPYGLRGMANNITQLASQMAFATKSAGSFGGALKQMGKAMLGPLGVVFAISVVVSIMEGMEGSSQKAKKAIDSLNETFGEEATKLMVLKNALNDSNISLETKKELVSKANDEFKGLNISISDTGELSEEAAEKIDLLSMSFIKNAKARAIAKLIQDEMVEQSKIEAQTAGENLKWYETAYYALINRIGGAGAGMADALEADSKNKEEALKSSKDAIQKYLDMLKKNDGELAKFLFGGNKGKKGNKIINPKELEQNIFSIQKMLNKFYEEDLLKSAKTEEEKATAKAMIAFRAYENDYVEFTKREEDKFKKYKETLEKQIKASKNPKEREKLREQLKKEEEEHLEAQVASYERYLQGLGALSKKYSKEISPLLDDSQTSWEKRQAIIDADNKLLTTRLEGFKKYAELAKEALSSVNEFIGAEFDRQLVIEQNKTNSLNEELNNRLLNENLSIEERKNIQQKIWQNDEDLRKKQEEIKKKKFNADKAFNIASALIDTGRAAAGVMADAKGGFFTRLAQAIPTIAFGLAQVAMIARQKYQTTAASTPIRTASSGGAGGSAGMGDREFNFNLAGNNQENQLANALQSQFNTPIKAFVVSKDITTQQELDQNIKNTATL
jgi:hypothetical protein